MNQLKIVQGNLSHSLQMKKLATKHQYLSASRYQDQKYLQYLQSLQKLNKQLITMLRNPAWENNLKLIHTNIETQNHFSREALIQHKQMTSKLQQQGRKKNKDKQQMQQFYKKRIEQLNGRIEELRDLMSEKELSFVKILQKLQKYEELHQPKLQQKLGDIDFVITDAFVKKLITKISSDKLKLAQQLNSSRKQLSQYKAQCHKLGTALHSKMNYLKYKQDIAKHIGVFDRTLESTAQIQQNIQDRNIRISNDYTANTKNLVALIKKQKLINDSLQRQFKEVIEINEDIINMNQLLTKSNQQKQQQLRKTRAKIQILQRKMRDYESYSNKTLRKSKSQLKLQYQYLDLIEQQPYTTYIQLLKDQVDQLDITDAVQINSMIKSYSLCDIFVQTQFQDFFGQIEQF